jgi:serine/threonine protein kinase
VHRDIKPANVLLTSIDVYGVERAKITDFGVAKFSASELTTTGRMVGTPAFMPPEQFTGAPIDGRTDIFSLGVILYWMATGEQPFAGETMTSVSYKVVHTDPIPPSKLNPAVPSGLEAVILKCLAKNPTERYQTGDDLAQALTALRANPAASGLNQAAPAPGTMTDATIDAMPRSQSRATPQASVAGPAPVSSPASPSRRGNGVLIAAALVVLAIANGIAWLGFHRNPPAAQGSTQTSSPAAPAASSSAATQSSSAKPSAAVAASQPVSAAAAAPSSSASATAPSASKPPPAAPVGFNPKTLDPKQNTRLKLDLSKVPAAFPFQVQMDGKFYLKGNSGKKDDFDTLFAPPGVHEFKVTIGSGSAARTSNIVSADFAAKKKMTLKVELRPAPASAAAIIPATTQVVVTLKQDHLFF